MRLYDLLGRPFESRNKNACSRKSQPSNRVEFQKAFFLSTIACAHENVFCRFSLMLSNGFFFISTTKLFFFLFFILLLLFLLLHVRRKYRLTSHINVNQRFHHYILIESWKDENILFVSFIRNNKNNAQHTQHNIILGKVSFVAVVVKILPV